MKPIGIREQYRDVHQREVNNEGETVDLYPPTLTETAAHDIYMKPIAAHEQMVPSSSIRCCKNALQKGLNSALIKGILKRRLLCVGVSKYQQATTLRAAFQSTDML